MKIKVGNLPSDFLTDLKTSGLTYNEMIEQYGLTRWGSRKVGKHEDIDVEDVAGNHEKIFCLNRDQHDLESLKVPVKEEETNYEEQRRNTQATKQTITNKTNKYLTQLEETVKNTSTPVAEYHLERSDTGYTAIIHETDPHFSAYVKDEKGDVKYNTFKAVQQTSKAFAWYRDRIAAKGFEDLDNIILLLGGDLLEGEDIYEGQSHKIEETLENQIESARNTYFQEIKHLKEVLDVPVKVVCVSGNHGDLGKTSGANADDIIYSMLEDMINLSDLENIKFIRSDRSDYTTFNYRNHKGYLTHGENRKEHIGTASGKRDWLSIKDKFGFDAAWRGHYHMQKRETVNGAPVFMTNSRKPGDDYTDTIAVFGEPGNAIYFATDEEPVETVKTQKVSYE